MSLIYRLMYAVGFTPWDTGEIPQELVALVEGAGAPPVGRALDIGCGTGTQAVYLARQGWRVIGLDDLDRPLRSARARAAAAGVAVDWVKGDVTRLGEAGLTPGFALLLDRGCYHGLSSEGRVAYVDGVTGLAATGAILLLMSFARNRVPAGPPGADASEIAARFDAGWELESVAPDTGAAPAGPLRDVARSWYRLRHRPARK